MNTFFVKSAKNDQMFYEGGVLYEEDSCITLTTALVVGAASTTFAAGQRSPMYRLTTGLSDAVSLRSQLMASSKAGDTTFRGKQNITRYEMAPDDRQGYGQERCLRCRYPDPTSSLLSLPMSLTTSGVRVSNPEHNADATSSGNGQARYRYWSQRYEQKDGSKDKKKNTDRLNFRLDRSAESTRTGMSMPASMHSWIRAKTRRRI